MKVNYDKESKILGLRLSSKKSVDSDVQGNVVVDRDEDGNIVNIEIMQIGLGEFRQAESHLKKATRTVRA